MTIANDLMSRLGSARRAVILDISKWNVVPGGSWDAANLDQIDGLIIRAGYAAMADYHFETYVKVLDENPNLYRGVYWYFSSGVHWRDQANKMIEIMENAMVSRGYEKGHWKLFFDGVALDVEPAYNNQSQGFALSALSWINFFKSIFSGDVALYSNRPTYETWLRQYSSAFDSMMYWHAQYPFSSWPKYISTVLVWLESAVTTLTAKPRLPASREGRPNDWWLWQIGASTGLGEHFGLDNPNVDVNISKEEERDFLKRRKARGSDDDGNGGTPEPPPDGGETPPVYEVGDEVVIYGGGTKLTLKVTKVEEDNR